MSIRVRGRRGRSGSAASRSGRRWLCSARCPGASSPSRAARRSTRSGCCSPRSAPTRSRTASTRASSPRRSSASTTSAPLPPSASTTGTTTSPPTGACCSGTTSRRSPVPARSSGPVLAAQMGYLPARSGSSSASSSPARCRTWSSLFFSMRRDGKSLGQMARDEIGPVGGVAALIAVFSIMIILLAVLALVVVQRARRLAMGHVLDRDDHPDRPVHGLLPAGPAPRPGAGDDGDRRGAAAAGDRRRRLGRRRPTARWPTPSRSIPRRW